MVEDVVDDLDGIDAAGTDRADAIRGLPAVEAEANGAHFSAAAQFFDGGRNPLVIKPKVFPSVKLNEVERIDADIF